MTRILRDPWLACREEAGAFDRVMFRIPSGWVTARTLTHKMGGQTPITATRRLTAEHPCARRESNHSNQNHPIYGSQNKAAEGLFVGGVKLPLALAELGLIDEYEFVVHPRLVGHGPTLFAGLSNCINLRLVSRLEFGSGAVAMRYAPGK
jgi:dihydrofolate reductase